MFRILQQIISDIIIIIYLFSKMQKYS